MKATGTTMIFAGSILAILVIASHGVNIYTVGSIPPCAHCIRTIS